MSYLQLINPGNSGCTIKLLIKNNKPIIKKTVNVAEYSKRLEKQRLKQVYFGSLLFSKIVVPKVFSHGKGWFTMEYIPMVDSVIFFERSTPTSIFLRIEYLLEFIEKNISESKPEKLDKKVIYKKISEIKKKINSEIWKKYYQKYEKKIYKIFTKDLSIPIGLCHGDLSLSNILFSLDTEKICFIDFLDSFVETPLVDIIKLRQDTISSWTSKNYPKNHDNTKMIILNGHVNKIIADRFQKQIQTDEFKILEILNYLRLAPYNLSIESSEYIASSLEKVMRLG